MRSKLIIPVIIGIWVTGITIFLECITLIRNAGNTIHTPQFMQYIYVGGIYKLLFILISASIFIGLLLFFIINKIKYPMEELTKDAKSFTAGEYTYHLRNYDINEMQALANAFDIMGEELNGTIRKLIYQKTKVESVLASLDEGIVVIDKAGYIVEMNPFAYSILEKDIVPPYEVHIHTVLDNNKLKKLIKDAVAQQKYQSGELYFNNKLLRIRIVPIGKIPHVEEYLLVLSDITQIRALEEMKYQFVTNVSHELKTPLTSINGFVETLKEGAIEDKVTALRFLNIIEIETKRLHRLIQDILLLSEIENMQDYHYGVTTVSIVAMQVIQMLEEEADKKGIKLIFNLIQEIELSNVNEDHIEQLLINLISNAIKYTDSGSVEITIDKTTTKQIIIVQDTGIGIPKESLKHIFERFYRVDKSRSRKSGGTGLGLSIVKHIIQLYQGDIQVNSEVGKGTTIIVSFPLDITK